MKIFAILLNPTIDQIYTIHDFHVGGTFQVNDSVIYPVGKSVSFSLGIRELCKDKNIIKIIAFIGEEDISLYSKFLSKRNIAYEFIKIKGKTRSNKTINDPIMGTTTHIREKGFDVTSNEIENLLKLMQADINKGDIVVFSGSIPFNVENDIYYRLINISKKKGAFAILDSNGEPLKIGIKANPEVIKPNLLELSQILNNPEINKLDFSDISKPCNLIVKKAKTLLNQELKIILVTLGDKGAILIERDAVFYGNVKVNKAIDTVGSGDSFLAGFILNYFEKKKIKDCFKNAIACGAANTLIPGPGIFKIEDVKRIIKNVKIFELN
jgi:1-phosphofructokinase family hexose kinase